MRVAVGARVNAIPLQATAVIPRKYALASEGLQSPATGWAGAATMLSLYIAYTRFQAVVPGGGPLWNELWGFQKIARDYVDILLCTLATFLVMVAFEKAQAWARAAALGVVGLTALTIAQAGTATQTLLGEQFTVPEFALLGALGALGALLVVDLWRRSATGLAAPIPGARRLTWAQAVRPGLTRFAALWAVVSLAVLVYNGAKVYAGLPSGSDSYYMNWRVTSVALWWGFTLVAPLYCVATVKARTRLSEDRGDTALTLILLAKRLRTQGVGEVYRLLGKRRIRASVLDLAVKFFWAPLMITFMFSECGNFHSGLDGVLKVMGAEGLGGGLARLSRAIVSTSDEAYVNDAYHTLYHGLFVVDVSLAILGYLSSSRWLGTKSKSVETTALGWAAALACYPPFNSVTGQLVPYDVSHGPAYAIFGTVFLHRLMMLATLGLFFVYVWATVMFGLRFSNLTHRGILDTGPFKYIRHPAYATKNLAWWTESVLNFGSPWQFAYILGCNAIYLTRALTEERHLMQFEDYRRYAQKVKWRFFPGLF